MALKWPINRLSLARFSPVTPGNLHVLKRFWQFLGTGGAPQGQAQLLSALSSTGARRL